MSSTEISQVWHWYAVRTGNETDAAAALAAAIEADTSAEGRMRSYRDAGLHYGDAGEFNRALELMQQALELATTPEVRKTISQTIGFLEHGRGRHREAQRWFQAILDDHPEDEGARRGMFWTSTGLEDRPAILGDLAAWREVFEPIQPSAAADDALWSGRTDEARQEYEQLLARTPEPRKAEQSWMISHMLIRADQLEEAVSIGRRTLELPIAAEDSLVLLHLADSYLMLGRFDDARRLLEKALDAGHLQAEETLPRLALCRLAEGDPDEAESLIRQGFEIRQVGWAHWFLALAHTERDRYEDALAVAEQCVARDSSRFSHELLAWVLVAGDRDIDRAIREARQAMELRDPPPTLGSGGLRPGVRREVMPWWPPAEHSLGLAYLEKKDARSAVEYLQRAAEISPERGSVQRDLERAKALLGTLD